MIRLLLIVSTLLLVSSCKENASTIKEVDPIYNEHLTVKMEERIFKLPVNYAGKFYVDQPPRNLNDYLKSYVLTTKYPDFEAGFPRFEDGSGWTFENNKVRVLFYLLSEKNYNHQYSTQGKIDRSIVRVKERNKKSKIEEYIFENLRGFKSNQETFYYTKDTDNIVSNIITCDTPLYNHRPSACTQYFFDMQSGIGFEVSYQKENIKHWAEMKKKAIELVTGFETTSTDNEFIIEDHIIEEYFHGELHSYENALKQRRVSDCLNYVLISSGGLEATWSLLSKKDGSVFAKCGGACRNPKKFNQKHMCETICGTITQDFCKDSEVQSMSKKTESN